MSRLIPTKSEQWAILIEGLSFFLVTLDLFGRRRIRKAGTRLSIKINDWKSEEIRARAAIWLGSRSTYVVLFLSLFMGFGITAGYALWRHAASWDVWLIIMAIWLSNIAVIIKFVITRAQPIVELGIGLAEFAIDNLFKVILFVFRQFRLDGAMLFTGAILFIVSKLISYMVAAK